VEGDNTFVIEAVVPASLLNNPPFSSLRCKFYPFAFLSQILIHPPGNVAILTILEFMLQYTVQINVDAKFTVKIQR